MSFEEESTKVKIWLIKMNFGKYEIFRFIKLNGVGMLKNDQRKIADVRALTVIVNAKN